MSPSSLVQDLQRRQLLTPFRVRALNIVASIACLIGLTMAWGTSPVSSVSGFNADDGKTIGIFLGVAFVVLCWRISLAGRVNGTLLFIAWLGIVVQAAYELTHVSSLVVVGVGRGLYVDMAAAVVGLVTAAIDVNMYWSPPDKKKPPVPLYKQRWTWFVLAFAALAISTAGLTGAAGKPVKIIGNSGNSGNTGSTGTSGTGASGTGATGNS
jgi:hypothetical protein